MMPLTFCISNLYSSSVTRLPPSVGCKHAKRKCGGKLTSCTLYGGRVCEENMTTRDCRLAQKATRVVETLHADLHPAHKVCERYAPL